MKQIKKFSILTLFFMVSVSVINAKALEVDHVSVEESDINNIEAGIKVFESSFSEDFNKPTQRSFFIMENEMVVTPLTGEIISIYITKQDPIFNLVNDISLKEDIATKIYESLTESNQLVTFENIENKMDVGSITQADNLEKGLDLSIDTVMVNSVIEEYDYNKEDVLYFKSDLFNISLASFNEENFLVFINNDFIEIPEIIKGELYSREEVKTILKPLVDENQQYFEVDSGAGEVSYGGISYTSVVKPNIEKNTKVITYIPIIITLLISGIFVVIRYSYDKKKEKKTTL